MPQTKLSLRRRLEGPCRGITPPRWAVGYGQMDPLRAPSIGSHVILDSGAARPAVPPEAVRSRSVLQKILVFFFPFVFRTPIAKNRVELFEGPVSGFKIRPV